MMRMFRLRLEFFTLALWWGSLTVVGFGVVPLLFVHLETAQTAGRMAAVLFKLQNYLNIACGLVLVLLSTQKSGRAHNGSMFVAILLVSIVVLLAMITNGLIAPKIVQRDNLKLWHALGSLAYLCQWAAVTALFYIRLSAGLHGRR